MKHDGAIFNLYYQKTADRSVTLRSPLNHDIPRCALRYDPANQVTNTKPAQVRAADLIGQLADPFYHRKLPALFAEFSEIGMVEKLGCKTAADLGAIFTDFFTLQVEPYTGDAIRYLDLTTEGKQWIANLHSNLFQSGHSPARIRPFPGVLQPEWAKLEHDLTRAGFEILGDISKNRAKLIVYPCRKRDGFVWIGLE